MKVHPDLTIEKVMAAAERQMTELDDPGFCVECGAERDGCEPDMRKGECESCGAHQVYGASELVFMMM